MWGPSSRFTSGWWSADARQPLTARTPASQAVERMVVTRRILFGFQEIGNENVSKGQTLKVYVPCFIQSALTYILIRVCIRGDVALETDSAVALFNAFQLCCSFLFFRSCLARTHAVFFRTWMGHSMSPFCAPGAVCLLAESSTGAVTRSGWRHPP